MHPLVAKLIETQFDDQRSPEWFALRGNMLTASDLAAAIGCNFFKTPEALIVEKCGYKTFHGNENTSRGVRLEPIVRDRYDKLTCSKTYEFGLIVHPKYKWIGGSPDGITTDGVLVEIKCPNKISKKVPDYYMPQVQLLLEILDLENADFVQYCESKDEMTIIRVKRSREWFEKYLPIMDKFWKTVLYKREHGLCEILDWDQFKETLPEH